jgi:hypothetical protein
MAEEKVMKAAKIIIAFLLFHASFVVVVFAQDKNDIRTRSVESLIRDISSDSWSDRVAPAEKELESRQAEIIPEIIKLLNRDEQVTLKNTADLIYPGAKQFYGHGWVMDYDVDWVDVRAGWLLERLTFQDFGFREGLIDHDEILMTVIKGKSDSYLKDMNEKQKSELVKREARTRAVLKAKAWWQNVNKPWKRFDLVLAGLKGNDSALQYRIFQWLRNDDTKCDGLTIKSFNEMLLPEVKRLANSPDENIKTEVKYLLEDKENWWYRKKLERDYPDTYMKMELK